MPNLFTVPAHESIARYAAKHLLAQLPREALSEALVLVPNRRSCAVMRKAFQAELAGASAFLPRIIALADSEALIMQALGGDAFALLANTPRAFTDSQHRYLLAQQVALYERKRLNNNGRSTMQYVLTMANALMQLQETVARAGVTLGQAQLRQLYHADFADHWREALLFLGILTETWPAIEVAYGQTISATREVQLLDALSAHWQASPSATPVVVVGSTASQPATAHLLKTIADMPNGQVILPGLEPTITQDYWQPISAGHPLYHLKAFLAQWPAPHTEVTSLAVTQPNLWLEAMAPASISEQWGTRDLPSPNNVKLIPCVHGEEEARVISLLVREALESQDAHVALVTPDEGLMTKVAAHLRYYDIHVDRLSVGTLAETQAGSLWVSLLKAMAEPARQLALRELLHHPLLAVPPALLEGLTRGWYGLSHRRMGQLPRHEESLTSHPEYEKLAAWVAKLASYRTQDLLASDWLSIGAALLAEWQDKAGEGAETLSEQLAALRGADDFGPMAIEDFQALLHERLAEKWRDAGVKTHPRIHFLTPIEARLQRFDRVILGNMQDDTWLGASAVNPWLNQAAHQALGLPLVEEYFSLMAHDVMMLASCGEVFLTYPLRDGGSPTKRSRIIEKLVALLAVHGVNEEAITAPDYARWASARYAATFSPEAKLTPTPPAEARPKQIAVTAIDKLFTDPFSIYARYVLRLKPLKAMDAEPESSDFGQITHRAIEHLTRHWNETGTAANETQLAQIANQALHALAARPNIDLFWRTRLMNGLRFVNREEASRRKKPMQVEVEKNILATIPTPHGGMALEGRIDRIEPGAEGTVIVDYKTGEIPSEKSMIDGRKLQMPAYAMALEVEGKPVSTLEYWQLPKLGEEGKILSLDISELSSDIREKLPAALAEIQAPETPFLACPIPGARDERYGNDYDGISRYEEWAG